MMRMRKYNGKDGVCNFISSFICVRMRTAAGTTKFRGSELVKIESIDDKINRLSEIVSTPTICTVKITELPIELPIWSVLFKAGAIYAVWKVCGKYLADKLEGWVKRILECDAVYRPRYQELKPYVEKEALFEHKAVKPPIIDDDID
jgi:hypothetical protein